MFVVSLKEILAFVAFVVTMVKFGVEYSRMDSCFELVGKPGIVVLVGVIAMVVIRMGLRS